MRHIKVVASVALIAILASVAVPGPVGSRGPKPAAIVDPGLFQRVEIASLTRGMAVTIQPPDPDDRSAGILDLGSTLVEPELRPEPAVAPVRGAQGAVRPGVVTKAAAVKAGVKAGAGGGSISGGWHHDPDISWFGPGLYGNGTACGQKMTKTLVGVAHRTLPCGTRVTFRYKGTTVTVPVVDRGPYVSGRTWDLTHGACAILHHCFTGTIDWKLGGG